MASFIKGIEIIQNMEKTIIGQDLTGFLFQIGFVEGIVEQSKSFRNFEKAFQHLFRRNKEYAVFLWNGLPVRLSYVDDIPFMLEDILNALNFLLSSKGVSPLFVRFKTTNIEMEWNIKIDGDWVDIDSHWIKLPDNYEAALNQVCLLRTPKPFFLWEWKLLLEQCVKAVHDSNTTFLGKRSKLLFQQLKNIESKIPKRGRFYRYEERTN